MNERWHALALHPRGHWVIALAGLVLVLPILSQRLVLDDHVLRVQARHDTGLAGLHSRPSDLFTFTDGDPANNHALMDEGVLLPWWTHPELRIAFYRPISSATHLLDFALFDDVPIAMAAHTLLWWLALLMGLAHVYQRFHDRSTLAAFALLLYTIDDVHGATLGWLSNRNAVIAAVLALPALSTIHRARTRRWKPGYVIAPMCLLLALLAGEAALGVCAYLAAYALVIDPGPWRQRVAWLLPFAVIVVTWRLWYQATGYGAFGSGGYHDPGREPLAFLSAAAAHVPILLASQFGLGMPPLADLFAWGPPELAATVVGAAVLILVVCGALVWPVVRDDRWARFWLLGSVLAVVPVAASLPGERLLIFVGVGAAPVIALSIRHWLAAYDAQRTRLHWCIGALLVVTHLAVAPIGLWMRAGSVSTLGALVDDADASLGSDASLADAHMVVVNPPFDVMVSYVQVARQSRNEVRPKRLHWLATASSELTITRPDDHTLRIRLADGYVRTMTERHYNGTPENLPAGHRVSLTDLTATVVEILPDGRPAVVDFTFQDGLNEPRLRLMQWNGRQMVPFVPPAVGQIVVLPADGFFPTLLRHVLTVTP